jgi:hypothetical protein
MLSTSGACKWPSASIAQCVVSKADPVLRIWFRRVLLAERKHKRQSVEHCGFGFSPGQLNGGVGFDELLQRAMQGAWETSHSHKFYGVQSFCVFRRRGSCR